MSFTYDPERTDFPTQVERVRMLLSDTNPDDYCFEDEEIDAQVNLEGTVTRAAAKLWGIVASNIKFMEKLFIIRETETIDFERASTIAQARSEALYAQANLEEEPKILEDDDRWTWDWKEYRTEYLG